MKRIDELFKKAEEAQRILADTCESLNTAWEGYKWESAIADKGLSWNEIAAMPLGDEAVLPSSYGTNVTAIKTYQSDSVIRFVLMFDGYGIITKHFHPDVEETIKVGNQTTFKVFYGENEREVTLTYGSTLTIPSRVYHQFTHRGKFEGVLEVELKRVN